MKLDPIICSTPILCVKTYNNNIHLNIDQPDSIIFIFCIINTEATLGVIPLLFLQRGNIRGKTKLHLLFLQRGNNIRGETKLLYLFYKEAILLRSVRSNYHLLNACTEATLGVRPNYLVFFIIK